MTQLAEYREGKTGIRLKNVGRFILGILLLGGAAAGIAFWFYHAHEVKLREAEAETAKEEYARFVVAEMVNTWHADDHWEKLLPLRAIAAKHCIPSTLKRLSYETVH